MLQCFLLRNKLHTVNGGGAHMHIYVIVFKYSKMFTTLYGFK